MDFGDVIRALKADPSKAFAREGWNGTGMYIYLTPGKKIEAENWSSPADLTGDELEFGIVDILPHIDMMSAGGSRVIGWVASQTDMLAEDWVEVIV